MWCKFAAVAAVVVGGAAAAAPFQPDGPTAVGGFTQLRSYLSPGQHNSTLYTVDAPTATYTRPVLLVDLHGESRYQLGYAYGVLLGKEINDAYSLFITKLIGSSNLDKALEKVLGLALDWQWDSFLSVQLPTPYRDELAGIQAGGASAGAVDAGKQVNRITVLANAPGDLKDFALVLIAEWKERHPHEPAVLARLLAALANSTSGGPPRGHCSMFGAWGSRTEGGQLFSGRNLDWDSDTGINKYKLVTVFHPPGGIAHATVGFAGVWGALTGMSAAGLTVHEANLEENEISFAGFPWLLRLRYIMESASNASEAVTLWKHTNNTVGFNHMVGSAQDAAALLDGGPTAAASAQPAVIMETMAGYTAFFGSMDPREASATYYDNATKTSVPIGFPLPEAVWRTNHGYDPTIRAHFEWSQAPSSWSMERYAILHQSFLDLTAAGRLIGLAQAVNLTAVVGDKGHATPYVCQSSPSGSNVLSVAYAPGVHTMAAAWERGTGLEWRPACCSTYLEFDMNHWF